VTAALRTKVRVCALSALSDVFQRSLNCFHLNICQILTSWVEALQNLLRWAPSEIIMSETPYLTRHDGKGTVQVLIVRCLHLRSAHPFMPTCWKPSCPIVSTRL